MLKSSSSILRCLFLNPHKELVEAPRRAAATSLAETGVPSDIGVSLDVLFTIWNSCLGGSSLTKLENLEYSIVFIKVGSGMMGRVCSSFKARLFTLSCEQSPPEEESSGR